MDSKPGRSRRRRRSGDGAAQPGLDRIAERMGVSLRKLATARRPAADRGRPGESGADGEPASLDDLPAECEEPESDLIHQEDEELVNAALFRLSPFEAWVIRQRYGFRELPPERYGWASAGRRNAAAPAGSAPRTTRAYHHRSYAEIGQDCGLSVHRVRLVEQAALDKLRKVLGPRNVIEENLTTDEHG